MKYLSELKKAPVGSSGNINVTLVKLGEYKQGEYGMASFCEVNDGGKYNEKCLIAPGLGPNLVGQKISIRFTSYQNGQYVNLWGEPAVASVPPVSPPSAPPVSTAPTAPPAPTAPSWQQPGPTSPTTWPGPEVTPVSDVTPKDMQIMRESALKSLHDEFKFELVKKWRENRLDEMRGDFDLLNRIVKWFETGEFDTIPF